jgi:ArsR family transcriptional regulator
MIKAKCCDNKLLSAKYVESAKFMRILGEENRLRILCFLGSKERCVCEINKGLGLPQNLTSSHLKVMREFGILQTRKEWKRNYYSIDIKVLKKYNSLLTKIFKNYEKGN